MQFFFTTLFFAIGATVASAAHPMGTSSLSPNLFFHWSPYSVTSYIVPTDPHLQRSSAPATWQPTTTS